MKAIFPTLIPAIAAFTTAMADPALRLNNQDILTGSPKSITRDSLVWESPWLKEPATFFTGKLLDVSLPATRPETDVDHEAVVTLTNGDKVRGQLASVTDEIVALDTWFAGRLKFNRLMVSEVKIDEAKPQIYFGPTGIEDWIQSADPPAWSFSQSAFQASLPGGIAREDTLVDECSVSFDAAWKGDSVRLRVIVFSSDPTSENPNSGYELNFQRGRVHLRNCRTQNFLGSSQSAALMENDRARIEIRVSAKNKRIALYINDEIVEVWDDPAAGEEPLGSALHFISGSAMPLRISNIRVSEWDGIIDRMPEPMPGIRRFGINRFQQQAPETAPAGKRDMEGRMELANGDSIIGEVISIADGTIALKTPLGEVSLPVSRLRTVALKPVDAERCKREEGDVRAWFPDGTSMVFRLESGDSESLTGYSQNFGTATFQTSAFSRIEFNIYSSHYQQGRGFDDW